MVMASHSLVDRWTRLFLAPHWSACHAIVFSDRTVQGLLRRAVGESEFSSDGWSCSLTYAHTYSLSLSRTLSLSPVPKDSGRLFLSFVCVHGCRLLCCCAPGMLSLKKIDILNRALVFPYWASFGGVPCPCCSRQHMAHPSHLIGQRTF